MNNTQDQYQKGYADGYKRHKEHMKTLAQSGTSYYLNVAVIVVLFMILMIALIYIFNTRTGIKSHYKGDCLIDLVTTYTTDGCLDK